jgi:cell wall-associated NlpC family hydrolase
MCTTVLVISLTVAAASPPPSIMTLRARVERLVGSLAGQERTNEALAQHFDEIQGRLAGLETRLRTTSTRLARLRVQTAATGRRLQGDAVAAYIYGASDEHTVALFTQNATQAAATSVYQQVVIGDVTATEVAYKNQVSVVAAERRNLRAQTSEVRHATREAEAVRYEHHLLLVRTNHEISSMSKALKRLVLEAAIEAARAAAAAGNQEGAFGSSGVAGQLGGGEGTILSLRGFSGSISGSATGNALGMRAFAAAKSQIGVPYVWGGESPGSGFDCSGLTQWSWAQAGISIPRTASEQYAALPHVSLTALQPGDLLFYYNLDGDNQVDHVVMYGGAGPYGSQTTIAADQTGTTIQLQPAFTYGLIGAARP